VSELARLLAGDLAPGVYAWSSQLTAADVRREVEVAGWRFVHLDTMDVEDKTSFLDATAAAFGFPDWFGRNWDAFADGLGDVRSEQGTLVLWDGSGALATTNEEQLGVALEILRERCESTLGGPFAVLVREEPRHLAHDV
jgi:RNAse (barnase) inhibitor barstar